MTAEMSLSILGQTPDAATISSCWLHWSLSGAQTDHIQQFVMMK